MSSTRSVMRGLGFFWWVKYVECSFDNRWQWDLNLGPLLAFIPYGSGWPSYQKFEHSIEISKRWSRKVAVSLCGVGKSSLFFDQVKDSIDNNKAIVVVYMWYTKKEEAPATFPNTISLTFSNKTHQYHLPTSMPREKPVENVSSFINA